MRVLLLTTDCYGGHGGIALYNRDVVDALITIPEIDEVVVIPRNLHFPEFEIPPEKVDFRSQAANGKISYVGSALRAATENFDLLLCGHINLLPLAVLMNLSIRAPLVLIVYGIDVWKSPYRFVQRWLSCVDKIWTISAVTRDRMNLWARLPESIYEQMPNAIHLDRYGVAEKREDLLDRFGLTDAKVIMTLARLPSRERYKGIDEVLEVMPSILKKIPNIKYLVVGDGDDRKRLEQKSRLLGLSDSVVFAGLVNESDKADYFRLADVFVMPGRGEGFGFVFLEALACGVPAVGSALDGSREALLNGQVGELADPADLESVEKSILISLGKPKIVPELLSCFAWPAFVRRVSTSVYQLTSHQKN